MATATGIELPKTTDSYFSDENLIFRDSLRIFLEKEAVPFFEELERERLVPCSFGRG